MLFYNVAALLLLPVLAFGQGHPPPGSFFPHHRCNNVGPYHQQHAHGGGGGGGGMPASNHVPPHLRHGRGRRRMAPEPIGDAVSTSSPTTTASPPPMPKLDCGEPPIKRQEKGCPCFSLKVLKDLNLGAHDYCDYYATPIPADDDPCMHLYPPTYASVLASTYGGAESSSALFDVSRHWDPEMEGGSCYASVSMSTDSDPDNYLDYDTEDHYFSITADLTEEELLDCEKAMNDLKTELETTNCFITVGGF